MALCSFLNTLMSFDLVTTLGILQSSPFSEIPLSLGSHMSSPRVNFYKHPTHSEREREKRGERDKYLQMLINSPNAHRSQDWARNSIWLPVWVARIQALGPHPCFSMCALEEREIRDKGRTHSQALWLVAGIPKQSRASAYCTTQNLCLAVAKQAGLYSHTLHIFYCVLAIFCKSSGYLFLHLLISYGSLQNISLLVWHPLLLEQSKLKHNRNVLKG